MKRAPISTRERTCLACRDKTCCSYYTVTVTARDLVRIAGAMQLAPADFLMVSPASAEERGAFLLHPEGPYHTLALARPSLPDATASPCIFLVRTNDQHALCGLGNLQPAQCRGFPSYLADGFIHIVSHPSGCVRSWSYGDIDLQEERNALMQFEQEEEEHHRLAEEWNGRVRKGGRERSCGEFCSFLVNRSSLQEECV